MQIRRVTADERLTTTFPLQAYAFDRSPMSAEGFAKFRDYARYAQDNTTLIAEEDGTTLAGVSGIPMRQNVRGVVYPMAGVSAVAAHPLARRRGHVRTLLTRLLGEMRDDGHPVSALYPFRPSFYGRFGYVGLTKARTVAFSPADLAPLLRTPLPGDVSWERVRDGYDTYRDFTVRLMADRHGFAVLPDRRAVQLRDADERWLATARVDGQVVGAVTYRIDQYGGELAGDDLLVTGPVGRALLLRFFAGHIDQVTRVVVAVPADETPELWGTDLAVHAETRTAFPSSPAPMARVLSVEALAGMPAGPGRLTVEVVDDPFIAGRYRLDGGHGGHRGDSGRGGDSGDGRLVVDRLDARRASGTGPVATLSAAGLSGLVYGSLDPEDVALRGFGAVPPDAIGPLRALFPPRTAHLFARF
jgi:predicted N-acetyltransferase YhbS